MDAKEIKASLKEARENIKNKDFKSALKICKNVLKADRNNYVGLVLFGVSLQETDQKEQAPNAFKKAIEVSPKQILAWQGLASFYEKDNSESSKKELFDVYGQLLMLESDLNKFSDICTKLAAVTCDIKEYEKCISILEQQESLSNSEQKQVIWNTVISVLGNSKDLTPKLSEALESSLEKILDNGTLDDNQEHFKKYLKLLYKNKKLFTLVDKAVKMHSLYPKSEYPLEWMCRAYSEQITVSAKVGKRLNINIDEYCDKLEMLNPNSSMVILAKGAKLYQEGSYVETCDTLKQIVNVMPSSSHLWALLCQSYTNIYCHADAEHCAMEALKILEKPSNSDEHLQTMLCILLVRALSYQTSPQKVATCIEKCKELLLVERGNLDIISSLARAYISDGNFEAAQKCVVALEDQESYQPTAMLLTALRLKSERMPFRAIEILNNAVSSFPCVSELWLELGKLQWEMENFDNAYVSFLKAVKLDSNCYLCFVYLGQYYSIDQRDLEKARRCFQKAFHLNPSSEEAGAGLSDIYRLQKHSDANLDLLLYVTEEAGAKGPKWAWLRLGLHYLERGNHQDAINSLRAAVRRDPTDSHCWESLADAYCAKGSYTSALRSYERVAELNPGALYPAYQVASIKLLIGLFEEAKTEFKNVVAANPTYVPALKGLGETYLTLARADLQGQLLGRCRDYLQAAMDTFTVAAEENRSVSCLWKLLGDVCTTVADLPDNWAFLEVKQWMIRSSSQDEKDCSDKQQLHKEQILQLGARCYCRSLSIVPKSSLLWHDLAWNYHRQATESTEIHLTKQLSEWALTAAKRSVTLNSKSWQHWNLLGVIAVTKEINNFKLAQHAFIKSIQLESLNPIAWTNLGAIYMIFGEKKKANEAFRAAQRTDPSYIQCWIGQALLAESITDPDTMDLFRHTTSIGFHPESSLGYSQWVCSTLLETNNKTEPHYVYSIEKMDAVCVAADAITRYTGSFPNDACACNMLGLLMERQRLYNTAANAFIRALKVLDKGSNTTELRDKVCCNLGRVLVQLNRFEEAIQYYCQIKEASFVSTCGLAIAYFKAEKYQESYESYESILHWFATDDGLKSHVLVAMAAMTYKAGKLEDTKMFLHECMQLKPVSVQGLFALCALGIVHGELHTSEAVLQELVPFEHNPEYLTHIAVFKAYTHYLKNRHKEAVMKLASATHCHPGQASLWLALALQQFYLYPNCDSSAAARCAQVALCLGQSNMDVSKVMSLVSLGNLFSGKALLGLRSAQKAVHMFPDIPENWVVLIASFLPWCMIHQSLPGTLWLKSTIGHIRRKMDATKQMGKWLSKHERKVAILSEEYLSEKPL